MNMAEMIFLMVSLPNGVRCVIESDGAGRSESSAMRYNTRVRVAGSLVAVTAALVLAGLAAGSATKAQLVLQPPVVLRGNPVTITGHGFKPNLDVTIRIGRPNAAVTSRLGTVKAGRSGGFALTKKISRSTGAGKWIVRACQQACRVKATAVLHVAKIKPV